MAKQTNKNLPKPASPKTPDAGVEAVEPQGKAGGRKEWLAQNANPIILTVVAVLFIGVLLFGLIGKYQIVDRLASVEYARGLITFILAIGTIGIAVVLTVGALISKTPNAGERFARGKEILTILIGVLGTIVGFYYGTPSERNENAQSLSIAAPLLSNTEPIGGEQVTLTSFFDGGEPPYKYAITFLNNNITQLTGLLVDGGWMTEKVTVPELEKQSVIGYRITVWDSNGSTAEYVSPADKSIVVNGTGPKQVATVMAQQVKKRNALHRSK